MKTSVWTFFCPRSKALHRFVASITFCITLAIQLFAGTAVQIVPEKNFFGQIKRYNLDFPTGAYSCQSIAHLNTPDLKKHLFADQPIIDCIKAIGPDTINAIIKQALQREKEHLKQNYAVFYHAQKLEFLLIQDLIAMLVKILHKKASNNFVFLRLPQATDPYNNVTQFLNSKTYFHDSEADIRNILLSVNPCLFGNISGQDDGLSCTFGFFLRSTNVNGTDFESWVQQIFAYFNAESCYDRHKNQLITMQKLLAQNNAQRTGLLLQIFVPQEHLDQITYRAWTGGMPFHSPFAPLPHTIQPSKELSDYTKAPFFTAIPAYDIDSIQYRLLITNDVLLNPDSKTHIFRYYNRIPNVIQYEQERNIFFDELARELA